MELFLEAIILFKKIEERNRYVGCGVICGGDYGAPSLVVVYNSIKDLLMSNLIMTFIYLRISNGIKKYLGFFFFFK